MLYSLALFQLSYPAYPEELLTADVPNSPGLHRETKRFAVKVTKAKDFKQQKTPYCL